MTQMLIEGEVGPQGPNQDGTIQSPRMGRYGDLIVSDGSAHFAEAVYRGQVFTASADTLTPGTAIGTSAPLALYNPTTPGVGGKVLVILRVGFAWFSGTLGTGKMWYVQHATTSTTPGGTKVTPVAHNGGGTPAGLAFSSATGLGNATRIRPFATVTALTADAGTADLPADPLLDGEFCVPPQGGFSIQEVGNAGTSPQIVAFITWMEIPA